MLIAHDCKNDEIVSKSYVKKLSCCFSSKNEYAEVVRVRQLIDDLVEAYFNLLQVC